MMRIVALLQQAIAYLGEVRLFLGERWRAVVMRFSGFGGQSQLPVVPLVTWLVVLLFALYIIGRVVDSAIVIEPFTLPEELVAQGYSGEVIANMLRDEIRYIAEGGTIFTPYPYFGTLPPRQKVTSGASTTRPRSLGFQLSPTTRSGQSFETVIVPATGLSVSSFIEIIQFLTNRAPLKISGEIIPNGDYASDDPTSSPFLLNIRFEHRVRFYSVSHSAAYSIPATKEALSDAAQQIYKSVDPFTLALYKVNSSRPDSEIRALADYAINRDPQHSYWALFLFGVLSARNDDHETAVWWFDRSIAANRPQGWWRWFAAPKDKVLLSITHVHKIQSLIKSNKSTRCEEATLALAQYEHDATFPVSLKLSTEAWVVHRCGKGAVETLIEDAVNEDPIHAAKFYGSLGAILYETQAYTTALTAVKKAIARDPNDAEAHNLQGIINFEQGNFRTAKNSFEKALSLSNTQELVYWRALSNLAWTYNSLGEPAKRDDLFCQIVQNERAGLTPPEEHFFVSTLVLTFSDAPCK